MSKEQTRITVRGMGEWYSTESYEALASRLRGFIHQHMPVTVLVAGTETEITVNRSDVITLEKI